MTRLRGGVAATAVAAALFAAAGCTEQTTGTGGQKGPAGGGAALTAAESLPLKGPAPKTGYDRDRFGSPWADTDSIDCGTRDHICKRDLADVEFSDGNCTVASGTLDPDPYTGKDVTFTGGRSPVDIDHVIALSDAWQKGAQQGDPGKRMADANDLMLAASVSDADVSQRQSVGVEQSCLMRTCSELRWEKG
ncbi:HNH endonuclease family protein [Streptomyces chromofuscus]|uniref:HNH endonuclease n=1 Tax=Streptomyces chromofuscus TaxID=42881 RepID=A0A7M2TED4_STRCW|nr:HNH endonuclease family protein [Streptomyces chromofuscus]QOV47080.1 HNH endonuclease [Streptomyces chromofuscus]